MNIDIFRRDIEIAANNHLLAIFFRQTISQSRVPLQFIFISGRADGLSIRCVNGKNANVVCRCCNNSRLWVDNFIAKRWADIFWLCFGEDGHSIV